MKISKDTLRGYILEEVLAYLIRNTGYRLLVHPSQDERELGWKGNGLVVYGRGSYHQVDVLGELSWIPAFTFPLRLFVEAKFRRGSAGIRDVRNLVATLMDVNQRNFPQNLRGIGSKTPPAPKYHYVAAIFSTSGFSPSAMDMGLAHEVSLIDLSIPHFLPLLQSIDDAAKKILTLFPDESDTAEEEESVPGQTSRRDVLAATRSWLRTFLGTHPAGVEVPASSRAFDLEPALASAVNETRRTDELFVGMGNGPYMLVFKAEDPIAFLNYALAAPSHDVKIRWTTEFDLGKTWIIEPVGRPDYRLLFRIPHPISDWIFSRENVRRAALTAKRKYFSSITIYRSEPNKDTLIRLNFKPPALE